MAAGAHRDHRREGSDRSIQKSGGLFTATVNSETLSTCARMPPRPVVRRSRSQDRRPKPWPASASSRAWWHNPQPLSRTMRLRPRREILAGTVRHAGTCGRSGRRIGGTASRGVPANAKLAAMQPALLVRVGAADTVMVRPAPAVGASTAATAAVATTVPQQRVSAATMVALNTPRLVTAEAVAVSDLTVRGEKGSSHQRRAR